MHKDTFQLRALEAIRHELQKGEMPLERIKRFAAIAIDVGAAYPEEIPSDTLAKVAAEHPEFAAVAGGQTL